MKSNETDCYKSATSNPFTPTFGCIPIALAGRAELIDDVMSGLDNGVGDPNRASIFIGARGTGKTVLLAYLAEEAEKNGWISVNVTSGEGMLEEILVQSVKKSDQIAGFDTKTRITGLNAAGFGISVEHTEEMATWRSKMTELIEKLNENGTGLLITVDEISPEHKELKALIETYQHFVRERRNVAILLAGLPGKVSLLLRDEHISFLRRAYQHKLVNIAVSDVAYAIKETVEAGGRTISDKALWLAADESKGFAFLIQLIGYHMWRQEPETMEISENNVESSLEFARRDMENMVFQSMYYDLSEREREFLSAMSSDQDVSTVTTLAERMGISANNASQIKKRLVEEGIVTDEGRGKVSFDMPMLKEYIASQIGKDQI